MFLLLAVLSRELCSVAYDIQFIIFVAMLQKVGCHVMASVLSTEIANNAILSRKSRPTEFDYSGFHSAL